MAIPGHYAGPVAIVVGPEKTATTLIQKILETHPAVALPRGTKETFFFDRFYDNGIEWYLNRFEPGQARARLVEVGTSYFASDKALVRIKAQFPRARIVICARDPVERAISHYNHGRRYGYVRVPFADALDEGQDHIRASRYSVFCPRWESAFGPDNVTVLDTGLLETDPAAFARAVFEAVGVEPIPVDPALLDQRVNEATAPGNFHLARLATMVANFLKRRGWYAPLARLRGTVVHRLVYGGPGQATAAPDPAVRARLEHLLGAERRFLARTYGIGEVHQADPEPEPAVLAAAGGAS